MIRQFVNLFSCCCVVIGMGLASVTAHAEMDTETKIRLLSEALTARNEGDLERSRDLLQELVEARPGDEAVARLLENVEKNIEALEELPPEVEPEPEPEEIDEEALRLQEELEAIRELQEEASVFQQLAERRARDEDYEGALVALDQAHSILPETETTRGQLNNIENRAAEIYLKLARQRIDEGDLDGAQEALSSAAEIGIDTFYSRRMARHVEADLERPEHIDIEEISPDYVDQQRRARELIRTGRAQYINNDLAGAERSFREVEAVDSGNLEAKAFLKRIAEERRKRERLERQKTREQMIESVSRGWERPAIFVDRPVEDVVVEEDLPLLDKMEEIIIPSVNFQGVELSRVISTLSAISEEYDTEDREGVNIVPQLGEQDPEVHINVRNLSLRRILDLVVDGVDHQYQVEDDVVIVRPGIRPHPDLDTDNIPVAPETISRLMGIAAPAAAPQPDAVDDPFAPPEEDPAPDAPTAPDEGMEDELESFLQRAAGVDFTVPGSSIIYDGTELWVTHTPRNLDRIRNVFRRLTDFQQVEIEAKFLEVTDSVVDELGFNWNVISPSGNQFATANRELAGAWAGTQTGRAVEITGEGVPDGRQTFPIQPPQLPGVVGLGAGAPDLAVIDGSVDGYDVSAVIRALSQRRGSDLLSAPKVTVMSGREANIAVAQEVRYPDSYGDTQSEVGRGVGDAGAAGVTITPGTPQDFQTRNVGVELRVTPTVEQDDSVTMDLSPRVTEFEGFVEFGGQSIAVTATQTVSVPSGFYQPIFATREVNTQVNVWDGATVVLGGLTREDVRSVSDKTPVLGDMPVIGRFFRSEGEASEKRNLLIFVTANLVSPGGSPMRQHLRTVEPGAMFQSPSVETPAGTVPREKREQ